MQISFIVFDLSPWYDADIVHVITFSLRSRWWISHFFICLIWLLENFGVIMTEMAPVTVCPRGPTRSSRHCLQPIDTAPNTSHLLSSKPNTLHIQLRIINPNWSSNCEFDVYISNFNSAISSKISTESSPLAHTHEVQIWHFLRQSEFEYENDKSIDISWKELWGEEERWRALRGW